MLYLACVAIFVKGIHTDAVQKGDDSESVHQKKSKYLQIDDEFYAPSEREKMEKDLSQAFHKHFASRLRL